MAKVFICRHTYPYSSEGAFEVHYDRTGRNFDCVDKVEIDGPSVLQVRTGFGMEIIADKADVKIVGRLYEHRPR